ncbi:MAG: symmetrical bis(5'-nucleosyl)-tetraphosphatase [Gammaproteobacteria bacterium]|nr:symmetrical bis(5'-nucleosyl)-tetraphosphatase [Gammaproteobacteria bacterium]
MATFAVGDVQGCYRELLDLLDKIGFNSSGDRLWFTGDLVNRGPESLEVLRFVYALGEQSVVVLGNHDLHLLAVAAGCAAPKKKDTLNAVLEAKDRDELLGWLRRRPLLHRDPGLGFTLIHAGLPPQWSVSQAADLAAEVQEVLGGDSSREFLQQMYGDQPALWREELRGWDRLRFTINCFTRMRFCDAGGWINIREKGPPGSQPPPYLPWYEVAERASRDERIIFGHWSTIWLGGNRDFAALNVFPLDRGCVWGGELAALRLDDVKFFSVPSRQPKWKQK